MKQQEEPKSNQKFTNHQINMEVMKYPVYYQPLVKEALEKGESVEKLMDFLSDFNL